MESVPSRSHDHMPTWHEANHRPPPSPTSTLRRQDQSVTPAIVVLHDSELVLNIIKFSIENPVHISWNLHFINYFVIAGGDKHNPSN